MRRRKNKLKSLLYKTFNLFILITVLFGTFAPTSYQDLSVKITKAAVHTLGTLIQTGNQISLTWTKDPNATGYHVYRTTNQGMIRLTGTTALSSTTTTFVDTNNIQDNIVYQYEVAAIINGVEVFSNSQAIYSKIPPLKSSIAVTAIAGSNYVDLTFNSSPSSDISYYEIYRNGTLVGTTTNLTYRDLGISSSTNYIYTVKAVDQDALKSDFYNQAGVTTLAPPTSQAMQTVTLYNQDFNSTMWKKDPVDSAILTFPKEAKWKVNINDSIAYSVSAVISNPIPIKSSLNEPEVSFSWTKIWGSPSNKTNGKINLYFEYKLATAQNWVQNKWSNTTNNLSGNEIVKLPNTIGDYLIRFRADLQNTRGNTSLEANITNVIIKQLVPNVVPTPPTSLISKALGSNLLNISWTASTDTDIVGYKIYRKLDTDSTYPSLPVATKNGTNYDDSTVQPGKSYSYKIVAVDDRNLESQGVEVTGGKVPEITTTKDMTSPDPPGELNSSQIGAATAEFSWTPSPSNDLKEYCLLRSSDGINFSIVKNISALTTIDKMLQANTVYYYRIMGIDSSGNPSTPSNLLKIKTKQADKEPPSAPTTFSVDFTGETYIKFLWNASTDNDHVDRYIIEQYENGWVQKGVFYAPATTGTIQGLLPGTSYQFRIIAVDASNNQSVLTGVNQAVAATRVDSTPPKIIFNRPAKNGNLVGTKEAIIVRFDDVIKKETVNSTTFKVIYNPPTASLTYVPGEEIDGTYQYNSETNPTEVQFVPSEPLQTETKYQVMVTDIENTSGTKIDSTTWMITTGTNSFNQPHGDYSESTVFCSSCHNTHEANKPRLLNNTSIEDVCFSCHNGTGSSFNVKGQLFNGDIEKKSQHPVLENKLGKEVPVQQTCTSCHNPHDGGKDLDTGVSIHLTRLLNPLNKGNLTAIPPVLPTSISQGNEVCWNCHGNEGNPQYSQGYLDGGKIVNPPYNSGPSYEYRTDHQTNYPMVKGHGSAKMDAKKGPTDASSGTNINCVSCHEKHGSDVMPLLRNNIDGNDPEKSPIVNGKEFCYQCHKGPLDITYADNSTPETASYDGVDTNETRGHSQFDCQVCHNPHGSPYPNYLRLNYKVDGSGQEPFAAKDAELCFDCHDQTKLMTKGASLSGTPQAEGSLHSSHLSNLGKSQCKDCHRPHGAIPSENGNTNLSHKIGFPSSQVTGATKLYTRDMTATNSLPGGSGACSLVCHDKTHSDSTYDGAYRDGTGITNYNGSDGFMLKDNWKDTSVLLNTRPDGTGVYDMGTYKIDYRNGPIINGAKTHFRDSNGDGFLWK